MARSGCPLSKGVPKGFSEFHAIAPHGNFLPANGFTSKTEVGRGEFAENRDSENRRGPRLECGGCRRRTIPDWVFAISALFAAESGRKEGENGELRKSGVTDDRSTS